MKAIVFFVCLVVSSIAISKEIVETARLKGFIIKPGVTKSKLVSKVGQPIAKDAYGSNSNKEAWTYKKFGKDITVIFSGSTVQQVIKQ